MSTRGALTRIPHTLEPLHLGFLTLLPRTTQATSAQRIDMHAPIISFGSFPSLLTLTHCALMLVPDQPVTSMLLCTECPQRGVGTKAEATLCRSYPARRSPSTGPVRLRGQASPLISYVECLAFYGKSIIYLRIDQKPRRGISRSLH